MSNYETVRNAKVRVVGVAGHIYEFPLMDIAPDPKTTLKMYARSSPEARAKGMQAFVDKIGRTPPEG